MIPPGIEAWVTENNPKYANRIIKQLKAFKKSHNLNDSYDPYKAAYGSMPTHAASNQAIQQMNINGHFCYAYKTFLGDAAFDTIEIYKALFGEIGFEKAFIPLRVKLSVEDNGYTINENMLAKPVGKDICQRLCFLCIAGCFTAVVFAHRSHLRYEQRM